MRKKDVIELGVTGLLGLLLLVASFALAHRMKAPQDPTSVGHGAGLKKVLAGLPGHELRRKQVKGNKFFIRFSAVTAALPLERDPFVAGQTGPQDAKAALSLDGIMWDAKKPTAIIGANFLNEGDMIDRFKVVKIHPTKVVLQDGDSQFELLLNQNT